MAITVWRLVWISGDAPKQLLHPIEKIVNDMGVPKLPSGQTPPMYSANHASCYLFTNGRNDPIRWSRIRFKPQLLEDRTCHGQKHMGQTYEILPRSMKSLREYDMMDLYPAYSRLEKTFLCPSEKWHMPSQSDMEAVTTSIHDILSLRLLDLPRTRRVRM